MVQQVRRDDRADDLQCSHRGLERMTGGHVSSAAVCCRLQATVDARQGHGDVRAVYVRICHCPDWAKEKQINFKTTNKTYIRSFKTTIIPKKLTKKQKQKKQNKQTKKLKQNKTKPAQHHQQNNKIARFLK